MPTFARTLKRRSMVVIFTDLIDPMTSQSLLKSLQAFSKKHLLVIVTLSDSEIEHISHQFPQTELQAYEKGFAQDLLHARHQMLQTLKRNFGAIIVDAPPHQLDESLINQYLKAKLRNRL